MTLVYNLSTLLIQNKNLGLIMEYRNIDLLEEGCIVAKDVRSSSNMLLLPAGTQLSSGQINMLKTWNVRRVFVDIDEDTESPEFKEMERVVDQKVSDLFFHNPQSPFIDSLKLTVRRFHRRKLRENS